MTTEKNEERKDNRRFAKEDLPGIIRGARFPHEKQDQWIGRITKRQASKFRNNKGAIYKGIHHLD